MDSPKVVKEISSAKIVGNRKQPKKEVSGNTTLNEKTQRTGEMEVKTLFTLSVSYPKGMMNKTLKIPDIVKIVSDSLAIWKMRRGKPAEAIAMNLQTGKTRKRNSVNLSTKKGDDTKQLKAEEVSTGKSSNEETPNTEERKTVRSKRMVKTPPKSPDVSEMVLNSFKSLRMRKRASVEAIHQDIEVKHSTDKEELKPQVRRSPKNSIENEYLEEVATGRIKLKRKDAIQKESQSKRMKTNKTSFSK